MMISKRVSKRSKTNSFRLFPLSGILKLHWLQTTQGHLPHKKILKVKDQDGVAVVDLQSIIARMDGWFNLGMVNLLPHNDLKMLVE